MHSGSTTMHILPALHQSAGSKKEQSLFIFIWLILLRQNRLIKKAILREQSVLAMNLVDDEKNIKNYASCKLLHTNKHYYYYLGQGMRKRVLG